MSRKVSPSRLKRVRLAVYTRDGFACRRCGWKPKAPPPGYDGRGALGAMVDNPVSRRRVLRVLQLDHIYPYSRGGKFTVDNLQTLCTPCNVRKGASI